MFHTAQKLCSTYMAILLLTLWLLTSLEFFSQYVLWQNNTSNTTSNFKLKKKKRRRLLYLHSGGDRYKQWTCFQIIVAQCRCNGSGCCLHQATFQGCWNQYRVDSYWICRYPLHAGWITPGLCGQHVWDMSTESSGLHASTWSKRESKIGPL